MTDNFTLFIPFAKVDSTKRQISGYASTPALDTDEERISLEAIKKALPGYMQWRNIREMHTNRAVGVAKDAAVDDKGLFLTSKIVDNQAWDKVLEGVYKGYSIGGKKLAKVGDTITELELLEISIVDRPSNPECRFGIDKIAKAESGAYLVKVRGPRTPEQQAIRKMAQAVELITKAPNDDDFARDGFSRPVKTTAAGSPPCEAHGTVDCAVCAEKRDVGTEERKDLASQGKALPGGGFPIKDKGDLANARSAFGRAKNKPATRALIVRRAQELGVALPDKWKKKVAKRMIQVAEKKAAAVTTRKPLAFHLPSEGDDSAGLGFPALSTEPNQRSHRFGKGGGASGHERTFEGEGRKFLELQEPKREIPELVTKRKVKKMTNAQTPAPDDTAIGKIVVELMKAGRAPTRADRMTMARGNLKKAKKAAKDIEECMKGAHSVLKAVYLAKTTRNTELVKAGKKPMDDDDDDDMMKAVGHIVKAHSSLMTLKTFIKGANINIKKAAGRISAGGRGVEDTGPEYTVPSGVKTRSVSDLAHAGPGEGTEGGDPPIQDIETEWLQRGAKVGRAVARGYITNVEAELMMRAAAAEAQNDLLKSLPAGGNQPYFPGARAGVGGNEATSTIPPDLLKGVNTAVLGGEDMTRSDAELAKVLGNNVLLGHGKSVLDPDFRGAGGI
jgi:hypothetical protein